MTAKQMLVEEVPMYSRVMIKGSEVRVIQVSVLGHVGEVVVAYDDNEEYKVETFKMGTCVEVTREP